MLRYATLALALLSTPVMAAQARTTISVSCIVLASGANPRTAAIVTFRTCGPNCTLQTTTY